MSSINHIESHFLSSNNQVPMQSTSPLSFLENIDRLLNLTKSTYSGIQYTGIRGLNDFSCTSFKLLVVVFSKYRSMIPIFKLINCSEEKVRSETLSLLWNFSAEESLKVKMFEENILSYLCGLFQYSDENLLLRTSAIIQNLSEFRFEKGAINQNQIKIARYQDLLKTIIERSKHDDVRIKFLSCNTLCNLSMNEENRKLFQQMDIFNTIIGAFNNNYINDIELPSSFNWVTLQPLMGLIGSKDQEVQIFILYCLHSFSLSEKYNKRLWKVLANNHGIESLLKLKKSKNHLVKELATKICSTLNIEKQKIETIKYDSNVCLENEISKLFNNSSMFPDLYISSNGREGYYLHKSICVSRCPKLKIILDYKLNNIGNDSSKLKDSTGIEDQFLNNSNIGKKIKNNYIHSNNNNNNNCNNSNNDKIIKNEFISNIQVIELEQDLYDIFFEISKWIYSIHPNISSEKSAKSIMEIAYYLELYDVVSECEYSLWHHIELENCSEVLELSLKCNAKQLEKVCLEFILRNIHSLYFGDLENFKNHSYNWETDINAFWYGNNWTERCKKFIVDQYQLQQQQFKTEIQELNLAASASNNSQDFFRF
ncbi:hypothetical protein DICPUDRAFT_83852 [Dictyostelium purpureum]|uniref:BTB domain-containing protein n=1 Tax=Dictyostelium purpureum TaxID=5786 RepID=F1A0U1_DICPU|nr:uncharacterized protein DICPUDRAFT_83852 [Dictyostelium purpureum]EGC30192.1 hypothetical protein DICPUDRAFT_83852 [Dictyostelium purpureum]|eukprot:XP_003293281.1 hypothetical protein DICPUDRAFT_83852 [Dictyostelium purpureum]